MLINLVIFFLIFLLGVGKAPTFQSEIPARQSQKLNYIYMKGESGYACFRIPAIVKSVKGTLLAFAEARKQGCADNGNIDLVVKRSTDGGRSWGNLIVVWSDSTNTCGNPSPVVERQSGKIYLLMTWNRGTDHESEIIKGTSKDTRRVFITYSIDDGLNWSKPDEITASVKSPDWTWYATGPGHGIQLLGGKNAGRLIIPCDHIERKTKKYYSHIIYSDDNGLTWHIGGSTKQDHVNECTVAELANGRIVLNMRNNNRNFKCRMVAISDNGGETWSDIHPDTSLIGPVCQGSLVFYKAKNDRLKLFFSNPSDSMLRKNMTIKMSNDNGHSWSKYFKVYEGPSAYSDLVVLTEKYIGILYEAGIQSPYDGIAFRKVRLKYFHNIKQ